MREKREGAPSVSKDKRTAVLDYVHVMSRQRRRSVLLPLRGLDEETLYRSSETGQPRQSTPAAKKPGTVPAKFSA